MDSFGILMELMSSEPTILSCLRVIQSSCLAQGFECKIKGSRASGKFQEFLERHYIPFCENAIRSMFTCGFVPWRLRRLQTGDAVPEVLPLGTYSWTVEPSTAASRAAGNRPLNAGHNFRGSRNYAVKPPSVDKDVAPPGKRPSRSEDPVHRRQQEGLRAAPPVMDDEDSKALRYKIKMLESIGVDEDHVELYEYVQPTNSTSSRSQIFQVVQTPMSHAVVDYLILRQTQLRLSHADAWNTQAKMVCSYASGSNMYNVNEGFPITTDWIQPQNRMGVASDLTIPAEMESNVYTRDAITEAIVGGKLSEHKPTIYSLPKNSKLESMQRLEPCQDVQVLQQRLAKSVSSIMGVPYEIIGGGYSSQTSGNKSLKNNRLFTTNMMEICRHLQNILGQAYVAAYGWSQADVRFTLRATPRISINTVEDLGFLIENGLMSSENAYDLSNMLLGVDQKQGMGKDASAGKSQGFVPPQLQLQQKLAQASLKSSEATVKGQEANVLKSELAIKHMDDDGREAKKAKKGGSGG